VLDEWFARAVKPQCRGAAHLVRYADDFVATFEQEHDARLMRDNYFCRLATTTFAGSCPSDAAT
jgi:hypothetical protein